MDEPNNKPKILVGILVLVLLIGGVGTFLFLRSQPLISPLPAGSSIKVIFVSPSPEPQVPTASPSASTAPSAKPTTKPTIAAATATVTPKLTASPTPTGPSTTPTTTVTPSPTPTP